MYKGNVIKIHLVITGGYVEIKDFSVKMKEQPMKAKCESMTTFSDIHILTSII